MTVSSTNTRNSYSGNGTLTAFNYTFKIFDDDDITVIVRTDATGSETIKTKTTHYTVSGVGNAAGGTITFGTAPLTGETVVLLRGTARTQATDYTPNDPFPAESHEEALDKLTFIAQELQEEVDRSIKVSRTNTITSPEFTVGATTRANKIFAFDSSGDLAVTQEIGVFRGTDATVTTSNYNERDLVKSTTAAQLNNIYIALQDSPSGTSLTNATYWALVVDAVTAATSATSAATSATAAATSATAAATSATAAATSATNAATSETNAATSATNAATSATNASTSETNASTSATSAASSATTATTQATAASTSATNAATSETNAATSATAAATSATNAATSETNAATSATTATTQATAAATSATNAATSETNTTTLYNNFSAVYRTGATNPTTSLDEGDLFYNTTDNRLKFYNGSAWVNIEALVETDPNALAFAIALG